MYIVPSTVPTKWPNGPPKSAPSIKIEMTTPNSFKRYIFNKMLGAIIAIADKATPLKQYNKVKITMSVAVEASTVNRPDNMNN